MATISTTYIYDSIMYEQFIEKALKGENLILSVYIQEMATKRTEKVIKTTDEEFVSAFKCADYSYAVCTEYVPRQSIIDGKVQYLTDKITTDNKDTALKVFDKLADLIRVTKI